MKNKAVTIFILSVFTSLGIYETLRSLSPSLAEAVDINIGPTAQGANVPGTADYVDGDGMAGFAVLFGRLLGVVLVIGAILVFMFLIWGGLMWITSGGDKGKVETARNRITQAVIGLIVLAAAIAIYLVVANFLGLDVFTFTFV